MIPMMITRRKNPGLWRCLQKFDWWKASQIVSRQDIEGVCQEESPHLLKSWLRHMVAKGFAEVHGGKILPGGGYCYLYVRTEKPHIIVQDDTPEDEKPRILSSPKHRRLLDMPKRGERIQTGVLLADVWGPHTVPTWQIRGTVEYAPGWASE